MNAVAEAPSSSKSRWPSGIPFIVGNEAAERFSFYGMKAILFMYLSVLFVQFRHLGPLDPERLAAEAHSTEIVHLFNAGVYAFPLIGAVLADRLFGKYPVIFWVSLLYCVGHGILAVAGDTVPGVYAGLTFIALGAGGIKPCVSANVGDQFGEHNADLIPKVYQIFYFSINFGSLFATWIIPALYRDFGPDVAFGIPGVLMGIATFVFWLGRNRFVKVEPKPGGLLGVYDVLASVALFTPVAMFLFADMLSPVVRIVLSVAGVIVWYAIFSMRQKIQEDTGFFAILFYCFANQDKRKEGQGFFDVAREKFGDENAEGPLAVIRVAIVFSMVSVFWALFDQHASSWVNQANRMYRPMLPAWLPSFLGGGKPIEASQISALNPMMVMIIIPVLNVTVYPLLKKIGVEFTPLRRMSVGMLIASSAFVVVALLQARIDGAPENSVNVFWQITPYLIMTTSEVLVSITGLEFAYTQAPKSMKSTMMGFWLLTVSFGNKLVAVLSGFEGMSLVKFFWTFAGLMAGAAVIFSILAYFYKGKTYLQSE